MANYLLDGYGFMHHWPWPQRDWRYNKSAIDAINSCQHMKKLMEKQPELWTTEEDDFFLEVQELAEERSKYVWSSITL